jgi:hypothetical protein
MNLYFLEVHMSEQDLDVLITLDDPGEDDQEEDTFHEVGSTGAHRSAQPGGDPPDKQK